MKKTQFISQFILLSFFLSVVTIPVAAQKVTLSYRNVPFEKVLNSIKQQTKLSLVFSEQLVDVNRKVTINVTSTDVQDALKQLLNGTNVGFEIKNNKLYLIEKKGNENSNSTTSQKKITGLVTDSKGEPIIGATVMIKGMRSGTVTDINGRFSIEANINSQIKVSYLGYFSQTIDINDKFNYNITLAEDTKNLDEVVVVGYGSQRKVNLTGAVESVSSKVFENRSVSNTTQALQGVANLNITLQDGKPTRSSSFNVRGITSIGQGGSALVLIDGVEGDPALLNPNDIESVSVLKDAASAAIYGARGCFGVVLISTKKAQKGKTTVNYTSSFSVESPTTTPSYVTDGYVWAEHFREAYYGWFNYSTLPSSINKTQKYSDAWLQTFKNRRDQGISDQVAVESDGTYTYYGNTDWYKLLYKNQTFAQDHNISISGGTDKSDFYISGRLYDYDGLFRYNSDTYKTLNLRAKGSLQATKWLKITNNMEFSDMTYHNPLNVGEDGSIWRNIADEGHPSAVLYNPDGSLTMTGAYTVGDFVYGKNGIDTHKKLLKNTTGFTAQFFNNKLRVNGDFTFSNLDNNDAQKRVAVPYSTKQGETLWLGSQYNDYKNSIRNTFYSVANVYAEYENTFSTDHYFKGMIGVNSEISKYQSTYVQRNGLLLADAENINMALGDLTTTSGGYERWRTDGVFSRLNYSFKNRYLVEVDGRYDGSSKFPTNQRYAFFPSISAGWRVSEEPFWKVNKDIISDIKLRASYGSLGNGNVGSYNYMEQMTINTSTRLLNGTLGKYTSSPAPIPESLTWETATTSNFGLDLSLINNKLSFTGDYYIRKTTNMYTVGMTLPDVFGATSPKGNYADMTTTGWEISLTWQDKFPLFNKFFNYKVKATLHDYHSVIDRYNNPNKNLSDYYEGMTVGEIWGYKTDGFFQSQDEITGYVNKIIKTSNDGTTYIGDLKFVDNNHNGAIDYGDKTVGNPGDMVKLGNTQPRYIYSFNFDTDWNGFFLSAFIQGVGKQNWFPGKESAFWGQYNRPYDQVPTWQLNNYWTENNRNAYLPRYAGYNTSTGYGNTITDRYLQNIAYIRLKSLQIGYTLKLKSMLKIGMQNIRFYLTGENLWNWSPLYKHTKDFDVTNTAGSDPDLTNSSFGDNNSYPLMKSMTFGLSVTF